MRATVPILCPPRRHGRPSAGARLWAGAAVLLLCLGAAARAAEQTPPPPLTIEADRVEINDKTGVSTYRGDVVVDRGDVHLTCDTLTVHNVDGQVRQGDCRGGPATFRRAPDAQHKEIHGHSGQVQYYLEDEHVILLHDAFVQQGDDTFTGQRIVYYMQRDLVRAGGSGRVHITIQPKKGAGDGGKRGQ